MPRLVDNSWGKGGGHQRPPGKENTGGWEGVQIKEFSMGGWGMDIFWNHTLLHSTKSMVLLSGG